MSDIDTTELRARESVAAFLAEREQMSGLDPECITGANWHPLRTSDLRTLLDAADERDAAIERARINDEIRREQIKLARAEALREAANKWQWGDWTVLTEPIKAAEQPQRIIGAAQVVTDWLRAHADAEESA